MARDFESSSTQYLNCGTWSVPANCNAITASIWFNSESLPSGDFRLFSLDQSYSDFWVMLSNYSPGSPYYAPRVRIKVDGVTSTHIYQTISPDHGNWHHWCFNWSDAQNSVKFFFDGTEKTATSGGSDAGSYISTNSSYDLLIGAGHGVNHATPGYAPVDGRLAELCIWNTVLTQNEIDSLVDGVVPYRMRSTSIIGYWPLWGQHSPEPDLSGGGYNGTLVNTPVFSPHPNLLSHPFLRCSTEPITGGRRRHCNFILGM